MRDGFKGCLSIRFYSDSYPSIIPLIPDISIFHNVVSPVSFGRGFVLDRFCGAAANAGHTMGTIPVPDGLSIRQTDVMKRTSLGTLSTGDAFV